MLRRGGLALMLVVLLVLAAVSAATGSRAPSVTTYSAARGRIISLTPAQIAIQGTWVPDWAPTNCKLGSSSPATTGFRVGDFVMVACKEGVVTSIISARAELLGPTTSIPGLTNGFAPGVPAPGPRPTAEQCATAWNTGTPAAARQAIAALKPVAVEVVVGTTGLVSPPPNMHTLAKGPVCLISFQMLGAKVLTATVRSIWKDGKAGSWAGWIEPMSLDEFANAATGLSKFSVTPTGAINSE